MASAMYPARTGTMKAKAMLPALFKKMNAGDFAPPMYCSTINEIAIRIPPPITNGSI